ncbi:acid phosphatase [Desulfovibrio inopinatus]|uniref:acid phosphatase n=1 Tax=Desulfovibrio inopinatus TaxID=102109 RepID=UPI000687708D|nr:phosphatase PAP2 family protein [Desulfovibrio inopinatus]
MFIETRRIHCTVYPLILCIILGCFVIQAQAQTPTAEHNKVHGYLHKDQYPDAFHLLPSPPNQKSAGFAMDISISQHGLALHDTPRFSLATTDANYNFPEAAHVFACTLGIPISKKNTPHLYELLQRVMLDAKNAAHTAKKHYHRKRPFLENTKPICTPEKEQKLAQESSYPSAHAAVGWAWALVLTEVDPAREDTILQRGKAFGENRIVCNVHWYSDIVAGRMVGSAIVARLHANVDFQNDVHAAKHELSTISNHGMATQKGCKQEYDALTNNLILQ